MGTGMLLEQTTSREINDTSQKKNSTPSEEEPLIKNRVKVPNAVCKLSLLFDISSPM